MSSVRISALAAALAVAATPALAQGYGAQSAATQGMRHAGSMPEMQGNMAGQHEMPATVTNIDKNTGIVDVTSEGMNLRLHFPPSALTNVKTGDKIKVQMGLMKT